MAVPEPPQSVMAIDDLDARLLALLTEEPRVGILEASRRLGVARGTVQARLDRLQSRGVVRGFGPLIDPAALGYSVTAFATLEIRQGRGQQVREHLAAIPELLEMHTITGAGDMLCRIVARSNADMQRVIDKLVSFEGIQRTSTVIAMANPVPYRVLPLTEVCAAERAADRAAERAADDAADHAADHIAERAAERPGA